MNDTDREKRMGIVVTAIPRVNGALIDETQQAIRAYGTWIEGKTVAELVAMYECSGESEAISRAIHAAYICTNAIPTLAGFTRETFGRTFVEWAEHGLHRA